MPVQSTYKSGCGQGFQGVLPPQTKILDETLIARIKGWSHSPSVIWNRCTEALPPISLLLSLYLPARASEQGNVIGSVRIYICVYK